MNENFDFKLIGDEQAPWRGYNSAADKTKLPPTYLIRGSYNVFKKRTGNLASRPGLKRVDSANETNAGTKSTYIYRSDRGRTLPMKVVGPDDDGNTGKLQVRFEEEWYDLLESDTLQNPAIELTRFSFTTWNDADMSNPLSEFKDRVIMVRGDENILHWSGGIARIGTVETKSQGVDTITISNPGTGYADGDILTLVGGDNGATFIVTDVDGTGVIQSGYLLLTRGTGYVAGTVTTTGGTGSGASVTISIVSTYYNLNKQDTSRTWRQDGFTDKIIVTPASQSGQIYTQVIISGAEYQYLSGSDTTQLHGFKTDITALVARSVAIQSVFVETPTELSKGFKCDFVQTVQNQVAVGSYTSRLIHISAADDADVPAFVNFLALSNALVLGDPDFVLMDDVCNGMRERNGKLYASSGVSDWWEIELNVIPNQAIPFYHGLITTDENHASAYVITKANKKPGTGRSGLLAHEFIDVIGDNIIYLGKDKQVRMIGSFTDIEGTQFPIVSGAVFDELSEEDFTGGHLKALSDTFYITAPVTGRHWIYEIRQSVNDAGQIQSERLWQPPQVSGISRIEDIDGVTHGFSNSHPIMYEIWDTDLDYDEGAGDDSNGDPVQLPFNTIMRFAYRNHGSRTTLKGFDKGYFEGYVRPGTPLYGNLYYEYQGYRNVKDFEIHTDDRPAKLFLGSPFISLGGDPLGTDPLGTALIPEIASQELLPKFRCIRGFSLNEAAVHEYCLEILSTGGRYEIICLGINAQIAKINPISLQQ